MNIYTGMHCHLHVYIFSQTFYLLHEEGFFVGASSGLNVAAAVKVSGNAYGIISAKRDLQCNVCFFKISNSLIF